MSGYYAHDGNPDPENPDAAANAAEVRRICEKLAGVLSSSKASPMVGGFALANLMGILAAQMADLDGCLETLAELARASAETNREALIKSGEIEV